MEVASNQGTRAEMDVSWQKPLSRIRAGLDQQAKFVFLMPAVLALLFLSIFPLIASLYLALTRFKFVRGGFSLDFVGSANFESLFSGREAERFLGKLSEMTAGHWVLFGVLVIALLAYLGSYVISKQVSVGGLLGRLMLVTGSAALGYLLIRTLIGGRLGSLMITVLFVFLGIALQYSIGLGLALLTSQDLSGRRFFRVVFLLPMMITPVGIAYMFRMITDTGKGPLTPLWQGAGLADFSWVTTPWGARTAIILTDTWQWVPFMFIVLLAALESQPTDVVEAATVDGANSWQIFRSITWPGIFPISLTLVLIRMIEAFKIIDLPNVMTGGGPGTSTESMTLHAFINWRANDYGTSAAIAYVLLIVVTFFATAFVQLIRQRSLGNA